MEDVNLNKDRRGRVIPSEVLRKIKLKNLSETLNEPRQDRKLSELLPIRLDGKEIWKLFTYSDEIRILLFAEAPNFIIWNALKSYGLWVERELLPYNRFRIRIRGLKTLRRRKQPGLILVDMCMRIFQYPTSGYIAVIKLKQTDFCHIFYDIGIII